MREEKQGREGRSAKRLSGGKGGEGGGGGDASREEVQAHEEAQAREQAREREVRGFKEALAEMLRLEQVSACCITLAYHPTRTYVVSHTRMLGTGQGVCVSRILLGSEVLTSAYAALQAARC